MICKKNRYSLIRSSGDALTSLNDCEVDSRDQYQTLVDYTPNLRSFTLNYVEYEDHRAVAMLVQLHHLSLKWRPHRDGCNFTIGGPNGLSMAKLADIWFQLRSLIQLRSISLNGPYPRTATLYQLIEYLALPSTRESNDPNNDNDNNDDATADDDTCGTISMGQLTIVNGEPVHDWLRDNESLDSLDY